MQSICTSLLSKTNSPVSWLQGYTHEIMGRRFPDGGLLRYRKWVTQQLGDVADKQLPCYQTRGWLSFGKLSQIITKICCCLCRLSVNSPDKSNQLCLCKYNKECRVEVVIYSAIWFRSNLFYSAFFGRISVNLFRNLLPSIPWSAMWGHTSPDTWYWYCCRDI